MYILYTGQFPKIGVIKSGAPLSRASLNNKTCAFLRTVGGLLVVTIKKIKRSKDTVHRVLITQAGL
jgi:hypothetical protein